MSKGAVKEKAKARKKEEALKKSNRKKILILGICALVVIAAAAIAMYFFTYNDGTEIYSAGGQTVHLYDDGTFTASLAHNVRKGGRYEKLANENVIEVMFYVDGRTESGWILNDSLYIPDEWDDGHGHGSVLRRVE